MSSFHALRIVCTAVGAMTLMLSCGAALWFAAVYQYERHRGRRRARARLRDLSQREDDRHARIGRVELYVTPKGDDEQDEHITDLGAA